MTLLDDLMMLNGGSAFYPSRRRARVVDESHKWVDPDSERVCKKCGESKVLRSGFQARRARNEELYYYNTCKACENAGRRR